MQLTELKDQLLEACNRLINKGFLNTSADSFSFRIPGRTEMLLVSGNKNRYPTVGADLRVANFSATDASSVIHGCIYQEREDVGAIAISSPEGVGLLSRYGGVLPPIFDEQVRHIGSSRSRLQGEEVIDRDMVRRTFVRGANAAALGERLVCLGMTRDRVVFNTELYEKCARAYVLAKACDSRVNHIPLWVRLIANRRLLRDEAIASASHRDGLIPEAIDSY